MNFNDGIIIGEIRKYVEANLDKMTDEKISELLRNEEKILEKIPKLEIDPEAQFKAKEFVEVLKAWKNGEFEAPKEKMKLIALALHYLGIKNDLIHDSFPIVGYDDDAAVINYIHAQVKSVLERFKQQRENASGQ